MNRIVINKKNNERTTNLILLFFNIYIYIMKIINEINIQDNNIISNQNGK